MTTENEKDLRELLKQKKELEKKIREAKKVHKKPPKPKYPRFLLAPKNPLQEHCVLGVPKEYDRGINISDLIKLLKEGMRNDLPEVPEEKILIKLSIVSRYDECYPEILLCYEGTPEELKAYGEKYDEVIRENKKISDKYNKELREWEELYG